MAEVSAITRREFAGQAAATMAAGLALTAASGEQRRKPNVIFLFSDEHRWQSMSFTEMPAVRTPNMKRLASQGVAFTHCISNYPVCSPYRAMLMTGRWPCQQGVTDNKIPLNPNPPTLAKSFQAAGYRTGYIGKWHLGGTRAEPFGFDASLVWEGTIRHWDSAEYYPSTGRVVRPMGYNVTLMTNQALAFIKAQRDNPFLLMVSWNAPHADFLDAPPAKKALYPEGTLPWRRNVPEASQVDRREPTAIWDQNSWPYCQGYHAHITAIDEELGRVMAQLDELGLAENTIVVYTSDHGSMMGSHGLGGKRQPFEESIRVPFIARWPGMMPAGVTAHALLGAIDLAPTLCGLAGVTAPERCVGQDFSPALFGGKGPDPEAQLVMHISKANASGGEQHPAPLFRGLRTRRHTYAVRPDGPWCLFDNQEDPFQMKNLIGDPASAGLRKDLHGSLAEWLRKAEDPFQLPPVSS